MKKGQVFCCSNNLLLLPISGAFVALLGILLIVLYLITRGLTTSLHFIEGTIPNYVPAILLVLSGIFTALLYFKPVRSLILIASLLGIVSIILCLLKAITAIVIYLPFLSSLSASVCVDHLSQRECRCYATTDRVQNKTFVSDESGTHTFRGVSSCSSIEHTLKDFLYIICIVNGFSVVACLFTTLLSILLLCRYKTLQTEIEDSERAKTPDQEATQASGGIESAQQFSRGYQESTADQPRVEEATTTVTRSNTRNNVRGRGHVQRSSSITLNQQNPPPHIPRHHSVATADTSPPDHSRPRREGLVRPRMPHILIRGGYLQSQLDGPTIPVYTLQGSNEAYISLTDLPSLQMPSLESVPAFIAEMPEPLPDEEPPPYSQEPQRFSPTNGEVYGTPLATSEGVTHNGEASQEGNQQSNEAFVADDDVIVRSDALTEENVRGSTPNRSVPSCTPTTDLERDSALVSNQQTEPVPMNLTNERRRTRPVQRRSSGSQHDNHINMVGGRITPVAHQSQGEGRSTLERNKVKDSEGELKNENVRTERRRMVENGNVDENGICSRKDGETLERNSSKQGQSRRRPNRREEDAEEMRIERVTKRKVPSIPNDKTISDKKQRIKDQVLLSGKHKQSKSKRHSVNDEIIKETLPKNNPHSSGKYPKNIDDRKSSNQHEGGAKPKLKSQRRSKIGSKGNTGKDSNGSSRESLSEIVSLLESVKGRRVAPEKKVKTTPRCSPLTELQ